MWYSLRMNSQTDRGEIDKNLELYEVVEQEVNTLSSLVENEVAQIPQAPRDSGSNLPSSGIKPLEVDSQEPQLRRSNRGNIPRRRFDIEGEAFMVAPHDDDEPRTVQKALLSSAKDEWMKAMNDEMESMRTD